MSWGVRDPGIGELIEYFERPEIQTGGWARLATKPTELKVVVAEIEKCRNQFEYFARNYAWITDKERRDIPFNLWPSQELLLEKINELKQAHKPQKIICLKARQLGFSTLIEILIAHRVMFFANVNAVIVSHAPHHSIYLYNLLTHCLERLPWYLQPMVRSHKIEEGIILENEDPSDVRFRPGLNSKVVVQAANQLTGVAQGYRISAAHVSELADVEDWRAKEIIEGDLGYALADNEETMAIIETTAKGSGRYFCKFWDKMVELGDKADWKPCFFPAFFEKGRTIHKLDAGWQPEEQELRLRDRVARAWLRCDNPTCHRYRESRYGGLNMAGMECPICEKGILQPYELTDGQLAWVYYKRLNAAKDIESLKEFNQEICYTPEDAFQLSGVQVFPYDAFKWVEHTMDEPLAEGFLDNSGVFHGIDHDTGRCPVQSCDVDHAFDDKPLLVWKYPEQGFTYVAGVDVSEGIGGDYSVAVVNRVSQYGEPDEQVATLRSNMMDPISFSFPVAHLGTWYNEATLAIECNKYDTCFSWVRNQLQYPNLYRWKHIDSTNPNSNKWGWWTNLTSRPRLYQTAIKFLKAKMWVIHSKNIYKEMQTFQKDDYEDRVAEHEMGSNDDELIASTIALYCSHDMDYDNNLGFIPIKRKSGDLDTYMWKMRCMRCPWVWGSQNPSGESCCPQCGSLHIQGDRNAVVDMSKQSYFEEMTAEPENQPDSEPVYDLM